MSKVKICIDAGHVGSNYNQSPVVKTYFESEAMWKLHLLLKAELKKKGFEVITTRAKQEKDLGVYQRGTAAKGCDVFLSLHSNACGTESVDYPVVYRAYDNLNKVNDLALAIAKKIGQLIGTEQTGKTAIRKNDSGGEYYGVMRGARAVGVPLYMLIEHSFHTNKKATLWLSKEENLKRLAVAEAELLAAHFKMEAKPESKEEGKVEIMGTAEATAAQMALYCRSKNAAPKLTSCTLEELAQMFLEEGKAEGIRGDIAFAQSLKETGFFKYGGIVLPSQNNYAGIGALNGNGKGEAATFPTPRIGVSMAKMKTAAIKDEAARKLLNDALDDVESLATVSVSAMEQTTAKALRDAVKAGTVDREELLKLGKEVFEDVKKSVTPEAQRVITENLGSFDDYLIKCIEDAVRKVKQEDPYITLDRELLESGSVVTE